MVAVTKSKTFPACKPCEVIASLRSLGVDPKFTSEAIQAVLIDLMDTSKEFGSIVLGVDRKVSIEWAVPRPAEWRTVYLVTITWSETVSGPEVKPVKELIHG